MIFCTGVDDAVNQATQCISTLKALSTRLLLRCFLGAANWLLCGCHQPVSPGSQRNLQHCGLRRDRFCVACRIQPSGSLLFGRSQSLLKTTYIIADFIQKIAASLLVACSQKHIRHYAFCSRMAAQSSAEHRALVIVAIPSLRAWVEGGA